MANQANLKVIVVYETVCVMLHYKIASSLTSFSTSLPLRAGFSTRAAAQDLA